MIESKFFVNPFAVSGDVVPVPDLIQPDGSVSYQEGFGADYSRNLATDPLAKAIPRGSMNDLFYEVTTALKQYQVWGTPNFITEADNLGDPYPYDMFAYALYDDGVNGVRVYQSLKNNNTDLPTVAASWRVVDNNGQSVIYEEATFEGTVVNGNAVYWDSSNTRYAKALADGTNKSQCIGIADVTNGRVYGIGYVPGLSGLTPNAVYYLSTSVAGQLTTTIPQSYIVQIGFAKSATELYLSPSYVPYLSNRYNFKVYLGAGGQSVPSGDTKVNLDTISYDVNNCFDTTMHRFVAKESGYYFFVGNLGIITMTANQDFGIGLAKNGSSTYFAQIANTAYQNGIGMEQSISDVVYLDVGDYVEAFVHQTTGASQNLRTGLDTTYLTGYRI